MRNTVILTACLALCALGCSKDNTGGSGSGSASAGTNAGSGSGGSSASTGAGSNGSSGSSASNGTNASSGSNGGSGASGSGGTTSTSLDAGLAAYCAGSGAPINVGDTASDAGFSSTCAGALAQRTFRFALCTCDALSISHPINVDSFAYVDSGFPDGGSGLTLVSGRKNGSVGTDNGLKTVANNAQLRLSGSLFVSDGGVTALGSATIDGEMHLGSDGTASANSSVGRDAFCAGNLSGTWTVAGDLYQPSTATHAGATINGSVIAASVNVADPCDCTTLVDIAGIVSGHAQNNDDALIGEVAPDAGFADGGLDPTAWASGNGPANFTFPCGRYFLTGTTDGGAAVVIGSSTTWHINGRTAIMVDGDFEINAGFTVDVPAGSELDLFIAGNLSINQPTTLGTQQSVANTRFYVGGSQAIALNSPSGFYGNIYAPFAEVDFNSPGSIYGAVFARAFVNTSVANIHYDENVLAAGSECNTPITTPDAGVLPDGGTPDAGQPVDAGPQGCATCGDCNNQACNIPDGGTVGTCGACATSADCCAPLVCVSGTCQVLFQ